MCSRDSQAQAGKINKVQGERQDWALYSDCCCISLYKPQVLFAVHIYIANIQYIMCSCYASHATPIHHTTHSHSPHNALCLPSSQFHHSWFVCQAKCTHVQETTALWMENPATLARKTGSSSLLCNNMWQSSLIYLHWYKYWFQNFAYMYLHN